MILPNLCCTNLWYCITFAVIKFNEPSQMKQIRLWMFFIFVSLTTPAQVPSNLESELVLLNVETGKETVILREKRHFEAPNWSRDGKYLIINADGKL